MEEQVRLVVGQGLEGEEKHFYIYLGVVLGEGGFGVVKKAVAADDKSTPLAVKIVPYDGNALKRQKIEKQIGILRLLPSHPNLVHVLPLKCFSNNNFYIFMEYCGDGTLSDLLRSPAPLPEQQIIDIFYQLISGYRVLHQHGIIHQDLKLENVLINDGILKISDFGFSILRQKYVPSLTRQGTRRYMPIEKLTDPKYVADQKTDIYALGVMIFEVVARCHPYIHTNNYKTQKEFISLLRHTPLARPKIVLTYPAIVQQIFDLARRMVSHQPSHRPSALDIFAFLDAQPTFDSLRERKESQSQSSLAQPAPITITEKTEAFVVPFGVEPGAEEEEWVRKAEAARSERKDQQNREAVERVCQWALRLRLVVYFVDRLARRLLVERMRTPFGAERIHVYNQTVFGLLLLGQKVTIYALRELRFPQRLLGPDVDAFRGSEQGTNTLRLLRKDEMHLSDEITDTLKRTNQVHIPQQKHLDGLAKKQNFAPFLSELVLIVRRCIEVRSSPLATHADLVTLTYLVRSLQIIDRLPLQHDQLNLQGYFYDTETSPIPQLLGSLSAYLEENNIEHIVDEQLYQQPQLPDTE